MATSLTVRKSPLRDRAPRDWIGRLGLAASPVFAAMAWITASHAAPAGLCMTEPGVLPMDPMAWMYLLMSVFHAAPWLRLVANRPAADFPASGRPTTLSD